MKTILHICTTIALASSLHAATWTVDNDAARPANFRTLQAAVDAAAVGDTILVAGSAIYYAGCTTTKKLYIMGPGNINQGQPALNVGSIILSQVSDTAGPNVGRNAGGSVIEGIRTGGNISVEKTCVGVTIKRCEGPISIEGAQTMIINCLMKGSGVHINGANSTMVGSIAPSIRVSREGVLIENCVIGSTGGNSPIDSYNGGLRESPTIKNTIFYTTSANNTSYTGAFFDHCMAIGGGNLPISSGNISLAPSQLANVFVSTQSLTLKAGSPAIGSGINGIDMGIYAGSSPYPSESISALPRVVGLSLPAVVPDSVGLTFEVSAEARE